MVLSNEFILTLDIDWAPDFVIDEVAHILIEHEVKATWFVTHHSKAVERLGEYSDLFELGIHPNMLAGSTHGKTEDEVLSYIKDIVPDAVSMRTHGLYQTSNWLLKAAKEYGVLVDVSLFLPRAPNLRPHKLKNGESSIWRIPYFWEDDWEMFEDEPVWTAADERLDIGGLRIFDFHPIHVFMNTDRFERYENLKQARPLREWDEGFLKTHIHTGKGPKSMFLDIVRRTAGGGGRIRDFIQG